MIEENYRCFQLFAIDTKFAVETKQQSSSDFHEEFWGKTELDTVKREDTRDGQWAEVC